MISTNNKEYLIEKYNIDPDNYTEDELNKILNKIINRNTKIVNINYEKLELLREINKDIGNYLNRGN